jgi:hypothetical protein
MLDLELEGFYVLESFPVPGRPSLDQIATAFFSRNYVSQSNLYGETANDTNLDFYFGNDELINDYLTENYAGNTQEALAEWLRSPIAEGDYKKAPSVGYILATLIQQEVLPYGNYLIRIWWDQYSTAQ